MSAPAIAARIAAKSAPRLDHDLLGSRMAAPHRGGEQRRDVGRRVRRREVARHGLDRRSRGHRRTGGAAAARRRRGRASPSAPRPRGRAPGGSADRTTSIGRLRDLGQPSPQPEDPLARTPACSSGIEQPARRGVPQPALDPRLGHRLAHRTAAGRRPARIAAMTSITWASPCGERAHVERVGDREAAEPEVVADQVVHHRPRQGRRQVGVAGERRAARGAPTSRPRRRPSIAARNGTSSRASRPRPVVRDHRQPVVGVEVRRRRGPGSA